MAGFIPLDKYIKFATGSKDRKDLMIFDGEKAVAYIIVEKYHKDRVAIAFVINPQLTHKGYGKKILQKVLPELKEFKEIHGIIIWIRRGGVKSCPYLKKP